MVDGPRLVSGSMLNAKSVVSLLVKLSSPQPNFYVRQHVRIRGRVPLQGNQCDVWEGAEPCSKEQFSAKLKASLELDKWINEVRN